MNNLQPTKLDRDDLVREKSITLKSNLVSNTSLLHKSKVSSPHRIEQPSGVTGKQIQLSNDELPVPNYAHDRLTVKEAKIRILQIHNSSIRTIQMEQDEVGSKVAVKKLGMRSLRVSQTKNEED